SIEVLPTPRGGVLTTRRNETSSSAERHSRKYASRSRTSLRSKNDMPPTSTYGSERARSCCSKGRGCVPVRNRIAKAESFARAVRVLVFVDHRIAIARRESLAHARVLAKKSHGVQEQVVEVHALRAAQVILVALPRAADQLFAIVAGAIEKARRGSEPILLQ